MSNCLRRVGDVLELTWSATPTWAYPDDEPEGKPETIGLSSNTSQRPKASETIVFLGEAVTGIHDA